MREETERKGPWRRAALLAAFALSGAVAAVATLVPSTDAELLLAKAAVLEPVAIRADEALLPAPATYLREDRLQRGDTLAGLLARLGVAEADAQKLLRQRELRLLRPGVIVAAEVRAGKEDEGELLCPNAPHAIKIFAVGVIVHTIIILETCNVGESLKSHRAVGSTMEECRLVPFASKYRGDAIYLISRIASKEVGLYHHRYAC